jgi:hypothetical protein
MRAAARVVSGGPELICGRRLFQVWRRGLTSRADAVGSGGAFMEARALASGATANRRPLPLSECQHSLRELVPCKEPELLTSEGKCGFWRGQQKPLQSLADAASDRGGEAERSGYYLCQIPTSDCECD